MSDKQLYNVSLNNGLIHHVPKISFTWHPMCLTTSPSMNASWPENFSGKFHVMCWTSREILEFSAASIMSLCVAVYVSCWFKILLILRINTGSGGICCPNAQGRVRNRKSNLEGISPRDLTYCSHKPECIGTTNPDRSVLITIITWHF